MQILGLAASPRKGGNSEILVKEMLATLDIRPCKACYACLASENDCVVLIPSLCLKAVETVEQI